MNNDDKDNRNKNRSMHVIPFVNLHPPGGLVAWPDGSTSRTGEHRTSNTNEEKPIERKGFVAWPEKEEEARRA